jgi:hypothetical protein
MKRNKLFNRSMRQDLTRLSMFIKQLEFRELKLRGFLKLKLRKEVRELKHLRDTILHRISGLTTQAGLQPLAMQLIREDIRNLRERCRTLKAQHWKREISV